MTTITTLPQPPKAPTFFAFHGDPTIKTKYLDRVQAHAKADQLVQGYGYWKDGKGCAVGCTIHGSRHRDYETELGTPWKNSDVYMRVSYPFFHADRIKTPTLFVCGEKDFNVPLLNTEQMYQALKSLNVPTQLVIYPGQFHGFSTPSYVKDRYARYLAWYQRYLLPSGTSSAVGQP